MYGHAPRGFRILRRRDPVLDGAGMERSDSVRTGTTRPFRRRPTQTLNADLDPPSVLALALQRNFHIPVPQQSWKFLSPLDQQNTVVRAQIIQPERFQLPQCVNAIEINVVEIGARPAIF